MIKTFFARLASIVVFGSLVGCSAADVAGFANAVKAASTPVPVIAKEHTILSAGVRLSSERVPRNTDGSRHWKDLDVYVGFTEAVKNVDLVVRQANGRVYEQYKYPEDLRMAGQEEFSLSIHNLEYETSYTAEVTAVTVVGDRPTDKMTFRFETTPAPVPELVLPQKNDTSIVYYFEKKSEEKLTKLEVQFMYHDGFPRDYNSDVRRIIDLFTEGGYVSTGEGNGPPNIGFVPPKDALYRSSVLPVRDGVQNVVVFVDLSVDGRSSLNLRLDSIRERIQKDDL